MDKRISDDAAFRAIDKNNRGFFVSNDLSDYYKVLNPRISRKERTALYYYIDYEEKG